MELIVSLIVGAAKLYLLILVLLFVGATIYSVYLGIKASVRDFINYIRRVCREHRP